MFKQAFDVRDKIKDTAVLAPWLAKLRETAERLVQSDVSCCMLSDYTRFYEDGDRLKFERKYFDRRGRLASYALMLFIYRDMKYLRPLEDIIWTICEEFTWVLPAHLPEECRDYRRFIDLFAAETGNALAEIKYLLSDLLSDRVKDRIHKEVQERIIDTYLDDNIKFGWYTVENNWAAVCAGSCAGACIYEGTTSEAEAAIAKSEEIMQHFLGGFSEDGVCLEGYGYWTYGFGFFMYYADLVKSYTEGRIDHFSSERVRRIARFINIGLIRKSTPITFADAPEEDCACIGFEYFLSAIYDEIKVSDGGWTEYDYDWCYRWPTLLRSAVWTTMYEDKAHKAGERQCRTDFYPDAAWYVKKTPAYILCAKGGNNSEPHNHNDLGSFYIDNYQGQILADLGSGEYTRGYFGAERYDYFVCGSQGHNVPVINGCYQKDGADRKAEIAEANDNIFCAELADAYDIEGLSSFIRRINMTDNEVTVTDRFEGDLKEIRERFIVKENAVSISPNALKIGNAVIECDIEPEISSEEYNDHAGVPTTVSVIEYVINDAGARAEFEMKIRFYPCFF